MAKKGDTKIKYRYRDRKRKDRKRDKGVVHVLPDLFGTLAIATPLISPTAGNDSALDWAIGDLRDGKYSMPDGLNALRQNLPSLIVPAAELGVISLAVKWGGQKLGLNKIGTKRWKIA